MRPPTAAEKHIARDPVLGALIARVRAAAKGTPELFQMDRRSPLEALCSAIVAQQLSSKAARTIFARVQALLEGSFTAKAILAIPVPKLRAAGLSGSKAVFVRELAQADLAGHLKLPALQRMDDDAVRAHLCAIKGVGPWTAEMFLMFRLRRPDILPLGDGGLLRAVQLAWELKDRPSPRALSKLAEPWRPYATTASLFLWTSLDLGVAAPTSRS
jgi:DNA-3-methyladenine glycosylase II